MLLIGRRLHSIKLLLLEYTLQISGVAYFRKEFSELVYLTVHGTKYSRMDQVKFVEDSL